MYSGYGYTSQSLTELTELSGTGMEVLTELTEAPGTCTNVVVSVPRVVSQPHHTRTPGIVPLAYKTYTSSGFGYISRVFLFLFFVFKSSGGWVKIKLKLPHFHVSDTCRVSI